MDWHKNASNAGSIDKALTLEKRVLNFRKLPKKKCKLVRFFIDSSMENTHTH